MSTVRQLKEIADEIQEFFPDVTNTDALNIAVRHQFNQLFIKANVIASRDEYPSALEAIAMALGKLPEYEALAFKNK